MEAFFATVAGGICLAVAAFPFAYGLRAPQQFENVDRLYTRGLVSLLLGGSIGCIGYMLGAGSTTVHFVSVGLVTEAEAEPVRRARLIFTFWYIGLAVVALTYLFALEVFRKTVIRPLLNERRDKRH